MGGNIGLLVLDIDGTIAGESNHVSPAVIEAVAAVQAKGVKVAIATGRMYQSSVRFHQAIRSDMPLAAYQGAWIEDPRDGTHHHHHHLPSDMAQLLVEQLSEMPLDAIHVYIDDDLYIQKFNPMSEWYANRSQVKLHYLENADFDQLLTPPTKVLGMASDPALIDQVLATMRDRFSPDELYLTKSIPTFFEAAHPGVNKGVAVKYMAEKLLGLTAAEVMVCGDSHNDLEMFVYAGTAIAMGNGPEDVQAQGDWVAPSVDDDGVAVAIKKFIL